MARTHRLSTTGVLIVCLVGTQWSGVLFASEEEPSSRAAPSSQSVVNSTSSVVIGTSEVQGGTSGGPAAEVSAGEQPTSATELTRSTMERSRFTLSNETLTANGPLGAASAPVGRSTFKFVPVESSSFAQRGGYYGGRGRGRRNGAAAAIVLGAVASIAGGAVLVYANRPECSTNQTANGCGYGTKVIGGAVLSAGIVGIVVGAFMWR
jgi:hypothetical protein